MTTPRLSFVIVNYNNKSTLGECLDAIRRQTVDDYEVLVVDNGSTDGSCELPHLERENWHLIKLGKNAGFAAANNAGYEKSRGEFVATVNSDAVLTPDWTERILRKAEEHPECGSVACRILQRLEPTLLDSAGCSFYGCGSSEQWRGLPKDAFSAKDHQPFGPVASAALYRRVALEKVGFYNSNYFMYYEDADLSVRLALFGYGCAYSDDAIVYHYGAPVNKRKSDFHTFHLRRNIEYLYFSDMIGGLAYRFLPAHLLYETLCFAGAVLNRQAGVFLRAKADFLKNRRWVAEQRGKLYDKARSEIGVKTAQRNLLSRLMPLKQIVSRVENRHKVVLDG